MTPRRTRIAACIAVALALALGALAPSGHAYAADAYPTKPVRFIVPYAAGGGTDLLARVVGHKLGTMWGQQVVVDNRAGAGGRVAAELTVRAPPDGYTLLLVSAGHAINAGMYRDLPYDPVADFTPIGLWATAPYVLVMSAKQPIASIADLIAAAKRAPGRLTYSSSGNGSGPHLSGELFKMLAGIDLVHVPYKGGGPEMSALLAGETTMSFASIASARPLLQSGGLKALGVTTTARARGLPDVPPIAEAGLPGYALTTWYGVLAPAGLDPAIVDTLNRAMASAVREPAVADKLVAEGFEPSPESPRAFADLIKSEIATYATIIRASGARVE
jgi:tripartite-type tricarboxylate transporter receptor subunit TctC